jgi:3-dehydroquinate synthase
VDARGMEKLELIVTGYALTIERDALDRVGAIAQSVAPAHRYVIIADDVTGPLYAERVAAGFSGEQPLHLRFRAGEASKTRKTWIALTDALLDAGCGRDTTIVALGGGVTGDLAGFVAATFLRGVPYVQVPTTLLAMVDSSIGGKTGVDTVDGKNLVGAFHRPAAVIADPAILRTLPPEHLRAGLAEAVKHAVIADEALFEWIELHAGDVLADPGGPLMTELIGRAVAIKARVVEADERESGLRKVLNFGHTIGHAIEQLSGYTLLHGDAVAIGMVIEVRAAEAVGIADPGTCDRIVSMLRRLELPTELPPATDVQRVLDVTRTDKKARDGVVEYALPTRIGEMAGAASGYGIPLGDGVVLDALRG